MGFKFNVDNAGVRGMRGWRAANKSVIESLPKIIFPSAATAATTTIAATAPFTGEIVPSIAITQNANATVVPCADLSSDNGPKNEKSKSMPTPATNKNINDELKLWEDNTCSICLCDYVPGEECTKLPCGHLFHSECITSWLQLNRRCPLCNFEVIKNLD